MLPGSLASDKIQRGQRRPQAHFSPRGAWAELKTKHQDRPLSHTGLSCGGAQGDRWQPAWGWLGLWARTHLLRAAGAGVQGQAPQARMGEGNPPTPLPLI